ncbi:S49 family peptidase [Pseudazoarcus pumilus]|uniref:Peptidase s49 n=1 Tax=Pseudazoarcus pumilus TaxID=2067960 RepID=A0A2I6S815_9RHOO|nr:S49 family peptidase [Pseudazoarcus pumilus]AUN95410.1 peptidase s49 [Pseudazoarcus pumilus]
MNYSHVASRIFNTPLLIHPQKLDAIIAGLGGRLLGADASRLNLESIRQSLESGPLPADMFSTRRVDNDPRAPFADDRPGQFHNIDGVAVVSASGALVHRTRFGADSTRLIGYNDIGAAVESAAEDTDVHAILMVWDSPGGEAQGAFELGERVMSLRGSKPIVSVADSLAASAAYLAAASADEFVLTRTGYAGSIGVVMRHVDFSGALEQDGIRVTHIFAGDHKVDGNPFEPLPESVRRDFQVEINGLYDLFVDHVATARRMDRDAVRNTQARVFRGPAAVAAGLADRLGTTDQLITELAGLRARSYPVGQSARATANDTGDLHMSGTSAAAGDDKQPATGLTQADLDKARAEGVEQGTQAERARVGVILGHESAACSPLALQCINTGLSGEQATAILGAAPKADAAKDDGNAFNALMATLGNPDVSGIEAAPEAENSEAAVAASIVGLLNTHR